MKIFRNWNFLILAALALIQYACGDDDVKEPIQAEFSANTTTPMTGAEVQFTDESTGGATFWTWTFEGGTPAVSHLQNPVVIYETAGTYEVKLVARDPDRINEIVKTGYMVVSETPLPITADFTSNKTSGLTGQVVSFSDASDGNPSQWAWEFTTEAGVKLTADGKSPDVTFTEAGLYTVTLNASNSAYTSTETKTDYINIIDADDAVAEFSADITLTYEGQQVTFTDESVGTILSWEWTFEGGTPATSTEQNPIVTYSTAGQHKVTLSVANTKRSSTNEKEKYVTVIPGENLATFLPFDGNALDKGPFNMTVVNSGASFTATDRHGNANKAPSFDGSSNMTVSANTNKQFGTASYTIALWLKSSSADKMMIWEEGGGSSSLPQAWFRLNDNTTTQLYRFNSNTGGIINVANTVATVLSDGSWHHVVCMRDGGTALIYVDGVKVGQTSATAVNLDNEIGLTLAAQYTESSGVVTYSNPFTGALDDLLVYKRALTEAEIVFLAGI